MCDKILLVVRHNDQTDQIFKTIIAPFLAAFLHTFQRWQRVFHHYIHGSTGWCSILHVRLCIKSWATSTTWSEDWVDLCVLEVWWSGCYWERVTAKETVTRFQISQRLTSLPTSTPCSCSSCCFKVTTSFTRIITSTKIDETSPCRKSQTSSSWLLLLLTWVAWTVMFSLASKWGNTSQTEMRKIFNSYCQRMSTCLLILKCDSTKETWP